jgi:hypothetical protein
MSAEGDRKQYEFNDQQSAIILDLASGLRLVGFLLLLVGVFQTIGLITTIARVGLHGPLIGAALLIAGAALIYLSLGWWFRSSSHSFIEVVATQGKDIDHLMAALNELRKPFSLIRTLVVAYAIFVLFGMLVLIFAALTNQPPAA